jgi:hypothetical protein
MIKTEECSGEMSDCGRPTEFLIGGLPAAGILTGRAKREQCGVAQFPFFQFQLFQFSSVWVFHWNISESVQEFSKWNLPMIRFFKP